MAKSFNIGSTRFMKNDAKISTHQQVQRISYGRSFRRNFRRRNRHSFGGSIHLKNLTSRYCEKEQVDNSSTVVTVAVWKLPATNLPEIHAITH